MRRTDCIDRTDLSDDAKMLAYVLDVKPDYFDRLDRQLRKTSTDVVDATRELIAAGLVDHEMVSETVRGKRTDRLKLALRPVEEWESDEHFLAALALRMPS